MSVTHAVQSYEKLLNKEYEVVIGRKGKSRVINICFDKDACFHAMGLNHLNDLILDTTNKELLFDSILNPDDLRYTDEFFESSKYYKDYEDRIKEFDKLESILDNLGAKEIRLYEFYPERLHNCKIEADYYILDARDTIIRLNVFLKKKNNMYTLKIMSMFIQKQSELKKNKGIQDYEYNQTQYTVLQNTKITKDNIDSLVDRVVLYTHPNYKEK